jgi:drug/metabolite transporter (DMT)-like permease
LAVVREGWPRFRLAHLGFLLAWSVIFGCFYQIALILISGHVEASVINVVMGSRGFLVFALAAILALERPSLRRLSGLFVGFSAIAVILLLDGTVSGQTDRIWLVATLVLPILLAIHTLLMSYRSAELGAFAVAGAMLTVSAALIAPFAFTNDAIVWAGLNTGFTWVLIALLGLATGVGFVLSLEVVRTAGPVFGGQVAYSQTLAGVVWAMLFLGERPAAILFAAIALVIFGFFLVEPKRAGEEFRATLPRGRKVREES